MSPEIVLYGPAYSAYTRVVRIALAEKGLEYRMVPVDILADAGPGEAHLARHPFGLVPVLDHGDFRLYETAAIARYLDEAFVGPALQPATAQGRARMAQAIHLVDSYGYWPWVRVIFVERVAGPQRGGTDEAAIAEALPKAAAALDALAALAEGAPFLAGEAFTLADAQAAPMIDYMTQAPEGRELLDARPALARWWRMLSRRPSVEQTRVLVHELEAQEA